MREFVTTLLDTLGLLAVAAGVAGGLWPWVGAWALCFGGAVILTGSWLATNGLDLLDLRLTARRERRKERKAKARK